MPPPDTSLADEICEDDERREREWPLKPPEWPEPPAHLRDEDVEQVPRAEAEWKWGEEDVT